MALSTLLEGVGEEKYNPYREEHVYEPTRDRHIAPKVPRIARAILVVLQLPTAKLLVEPPAVRAVAHLDI
jgi:hypothetical protein